MTEEEAKQKWCPERAKAAAARGHDPFGKDANCIASDCMMFRVRKNDRAEVVDCYCGLGGNP